MPPEHNRMPPLSTFVSTYVFYFYNFAPTRNLEITIKTQTAPDNIASETRSYINPNRTVIMETVSRNYTTQYNRCIQTPERSKNQKKCTCDNAKCIGIRVVCENCKSNDNLNDESTYYGVAQIYLKSQD